MKATGTRQAWETSPFAVGFVWYLEVPIPSTGWFGSSFFHIFPLYRCHRLGVQLRSHFQTPWSMGTDFLLVFEVHLSDLGLARHVGVAG